MAGEEVELNIHLRSAKARILVRLPSRPQSLFSMACVETPTLDLTVCVLTAARAALTECRTSLRFFLTHPFAKALCPERAARFTPP